MNFYQGSDKNLVEQLVRYEKLIQETSGICFNIYFSKIRKTWVASSIPVRFESVVIDILLEQVNDYLEANRLPTNKINYQFKYKYRKAK